MAVERSPQSFRALTLPSSIAGVRSATICRYELDERAIPIDHEVYGAVQASAGKISDDARQIGRRSEMQHDELGLDRTTRLDTGQENTLPGAFDIPIDEPLVALAVRDRVVSGPGDE